jgi:hypothetical protein
MHTLYHGFCRVERPVVLPLRAFLLLVLALLTGGSLFAQGLNPEPGVVYSDLSIPRVDLYLHPDSLAAMYDDPTSDDYFRARYVFTRGAYRDSVADIGLRFRGNFSRYANKKNFKVSFNTFERGRKWNGLEKLNLNGQANDPSVIRAKLLSDLIPAMGVEGTRAAHTEVYINGDYYGLYINVEHIDEQFTKWHFGTNRGNLYKCTYPVDLVWQGSSPSSYAYCEWKRGGDTPAYNDLIHFIDVLNNTPDDDLACALEQVFNVDDYLRQAAIDVMTGNWDGYIYNKNNLYLFQNTATGRMEYIIYDTDNTYGIDWIGRDWGTRDIYSWSRGGESRPLYERLVANPEYRARFSWYVERLAEQVMEPGSYFPRIDALKALITPSAEADPYRPLDQGYSIDDFHDSYDNALGGHVDYGLKPFVQTRIGTAIGQLESFDMAPVVNHLWHNHPVLGRAPQLRVFVEDDQADPAVYAVYALDGVLDSVLMADDGLHGDGAAGDGIYGAVLDALEEPALWSLRVHAYGADGRTTRYPCQPLEWSIAEPQYGLYINEFMARNQTYMANEQGLYADWLELYNAGPDAVFLGDKYLSADPRYPAQWRMPAVVLEPGVFMWFWADDEPGLGPNHTNFRIAAAGGTLGIYASEAERHYPIHQLSYGAQTADISWGLLPDGQGEGQALSAATPGWSNVLTGLEPIAVEGQPLLFPNPASDRVYLRATCGDWDLLSAEGSLLRGYRQAAQTWLDLSGLQPGLYLLRSRCAETQQVLKLVVAPSR